MNETINIFENKVFQGMSGTYIIHSIFSKEEIARALAHFLEEEYGLQPENLENLDQEEQQLIIYKFHNWFLQLDISAQRLLEKIVKLPGISTRLEK